MNKTLSENIVYPQQNACRCCLKNLKVGIHIKKEYLLESIQMQIIQEFQYLKLKICLGDGKPQYICKECFTNLKTLSSFRMLCLRSQEILDNYFENPSVEILDEEPKEYQKDVKKYSGEASKVQPVQHMSSFEFEEETSEMGKNEFMEDSVAEVEDKCEDKKEEEKEGTWQWFTPFTREISELQINVSTLSGKDEAAFICSICSESFNEEIMLLQHVIGHPTVMDHPITKYVVCHICDKEFKGKGELRHHMHSLHPKIRPHACPICCKTFQSISNRNTHIQSHNQDKTFKCSICQQGFKSKVYMNKHSKSVHDVTEHECPHCLATFTNKVKFDYHLKSHNINKKYKCRYCEKSFIQHHHLVNHERTHTGDRPFLCNYCGKHFKQECNFKLHLRYHTGVRPYVCNICGKDFVQRGSFVMHMKQHSGEKQWQCERCGKHFIQKSSLTVHLRTHTGERPFKCDICDKAFIQAQQLKYHKHSVHSGPPGGARDSFSSQESRPHPYICQLCNKGFKLPSSLSSHLKVHTEVRKHACPQCGNSFKRAEHLRIHINGVHLKQRPYECNLCEKTFAQSGDRNMHMRRHTGEKPHKCTFCNRSFRLLKAMRAHTRIHTGERPYCCDICKVDFMTYTALATHTMKHEDGALYNAKPDIQKENLLT